MEHKMKFEDLQKEWDKDCKIDRTDLTAESLNTPSLISKYYKHYIRERFLLKKLETDLSILTLEKREFYTQGPTKEQLAKGWNMPPKGMILKNEVDHYLQADKEIVQMTLKVFGQKQKVEFLQAIIDDLNRRSFTIKNAIDFLKFTNGMD